MKAITVVCKAENLVKGTLITAPSEYTIDIELQNHP